MAETLRVVVDGIARQGSHNLAVTLHPTDGQRLPAWAPGAHVDLHLGNGLIRPYSLTGHPQNQDQYLICVARESRSRGGSRYIHDILRPGQELTISPPRNLFPLVQAGKVILVAAGIGITPLYAMAEHLEATGTPFALYYYVKQRGNGAFLAPLSRSFTHGRGEIFYSDEGHSPRVLPPAELCDPQTDTHIYICGPQGFMDYIRQLATDSGWADDQIHTEAFQPPAPVVPQGGERIFTVTLGSTGQQWPVPPDQTIAQVLQGNGVDVPLSCEMGMCGACLTPVKEGVVDHRDTVQSAAEKAAPEQHIALCCSRAHCDNLVIDL